jgi:hypothetical protein
MKAGGILSMKKHRAIPDGYMTVGEVAKNSSDYIEAALGSYFGSIGYNPFEGMGNQ